MKRAPTILSEVEQRELLTRFRDNGDIEARNSVIEKNLRLVYHIIKKYKGGMIPDDDLSSIGSIGLIKATRAFKLEKGTRFSTYAARCIENEILMAFRHRKKFMKESASLDDIIGIDKDGEELYLRDIIGGDYDIADDAVRNVASSDLISVLKRYSEVGLNKRDITVLYLRFGFGKRTYTQKEVSKILGISVPYVSRIEKNSIAKLKKSCQAFL
ncbi:MAG: sigma-70 family RNA polymerase sigma factor [Candidatus Colwellbacteria bacterium]|nr:sigma-70 family RNA polymerase sigma factor [Candidatus Colwellbacteria bacterium]